MSKQNDKNINSNEVEKTKTQEARMITNSFAPLKFKHSSVAQRDTISYQ